MKRLVRVFALLFVGILLVCGATYAWADVTSSAMYEKKWDVVPASFPIPLPLTDSERVTLVAENPDVDLDAVALERAIARGKHLSESRAGCSDCHGIDLGGRVIISDPATGRFVSPNITRGKGSVVADYQPADWVGIIRHGIARGGKTSLMPALDTTWLSDQEIADIVAYVESVPPVDRPSVPCELGPVMKVLVATGQFQLSAYRIDHGAGRLRYPPDASPTVEFGKHVIVSCTGCHGEHLSGGPIPGTPPDWPPAQNLTLDETGLAGWSDDDFLRAIRTGVRPDGTTINGTVMPLGIFSNFTDEEVGALWAYLQTVPPRPTGNR